MLFTKLSDSEKRKLLKKKLETGELLQFPGAPFALAAQLIEEKSFDGVYVSGAVLANTSGLPDIGMTTLTEVVTRSGEIAKSTDLPTIVDADTGFGPPMNVARTIRALEGAGLSGCHIEDQVNPKRCGHLDNKSLVSELEMVQKIKTAVESRQDPHFLLIARTDARGVEGLDSAVKRAKAYVEAGADMIFIEALKDLGEFEVFRKEVTGYLLANMTEFGKSELLTTEQLKSVGFNLVIYPVTMLRLAMQVMESSLDVIKKDGTQESVVAKMQTRKRLYDLLKYEKYNEFDKGVFNFQLSQDQ